MGIKTLLSETGASQRDFARSIGFSDSSVSRIVNGLMTPSKPAIDAILAFLSERLSRTVTYEEAFGATKKRTSRRAA